MDARPWQVALIVLGFAVGAVAIYFSLGRGGDPLDHSYVLVDVSTGDLFRVADSTKTRLVLPARHPETGVIALVRVQKDAQGTWRVIERDRELLRTNQLDPEVAISAVDVDSGQVITPSGDVKIYRPK